MTKRTTSKSGVWLPLELIQPRSAALAPNVLRACVVDAIEAADARARRIEDAKELLREMAAPRSFVSHGDFVSEPVTADMLRGLGVVR